MVSVVRAMKGYLCEKVFRLAYQRWRNDIKLSYHSEKIELKNGDVFLFRVDGNPCLYRLPWGMIANCGNRLRGLRCDKYIDSPEEFKKFLEEYNSNAVSA